MSLIGALNIGKSGLATAQAALQVSSNNIANAGNPNYTRQVAKLATNGDQQFQQGLYIGTGVNLESIQRQVDEALSSRLRSALSDNQGGQVGQQWMGQLEAVFNALSSSNLSGQFSKFFASWSNLANKPQDMGLRQVVLQEATSTANFFNNLRGQLESLRGDVDSQISGQMTDANGLCDKIASLNAQIVIAEGGSVGSANGLRDQRDQALGDLSKLIDIKTIAQSNGSVNVYIGSQPIVLDSQNRGITLKQSVVNGQVQSKLLIKADNGEIDATSGQLGALSVVRQNVTDAISQIDSLANSFMFEVNKIHSSGQGMEGFDSLTSTAAVDDATVALNDLDHNGLKFTPVNGSFVVHVKQKATGQITSTLVQVDLDGLNNNDTTLNSLAGQLDAIDGITATVSGGKLKINSESNQLEFSFSQDSSGALAAMGVNNLFSGGDASNIAVNQQIKDDPILLAAAKNGQPTDNQTALALAQLENTTLSSLGGRSIKDTYQQMINTIAVKADEAKTNAESAQVVVDTLTAQQQALSGVSLDEEAINIMKQQRAFQASSRLIAVVNEMMDTVLKLI